MSHKDLITLNAHVREGMPVPVDVQARLLEEGIDVGRLTDRLVDIHKLSQPQETFQ